MTERSAPGVRFAALWSNLGSEMELMDGTLLVTLFALALVVVFTRRWIRDAIAEALRNFPGGPPTGPHPSPADDCFVLRRRRR